MLREIHLHFGLGYFRSNWKPKKPRSSGKDYSPRGDVDIHNFTGMAHLKLLVTFLVGDFALKSHKRKDFEIWKQLVDLASELRPGKPCSSELALRLLGLTEKLSAPRAKGQSANAKKQMKKWKAWHQKRLRTESYQTSLSFDSTGK
jgi:hypothetical protein